MSDCEDCHDGSCEHCQMMSRARASWAIEDLRPNWLARHGVPARWCSFDFDESVRAMPKKLVGWDGKRDVLLSGPNGTGKTSIAVELAWRARETLGGLVFVYASDAVKLEIEGRGDHLHSAPCLLLDDLGKGHSGGSWEVLFRLVQSRYGRMVPTLYTTNLAGDAIPDPAMLSRVSDSIVVVLGGRDLRIRQ